MGVLLLGSLPGIIIGSWSAVRVPETVLRVALAAVLTVVAGKIGSEELHLQTLVATTAASTVGR
jgi:hypothetical protein